MSDAYLYGDLIRGAVEVDSDTIVMASSQASPTKYPLNKTNCQGSAKYSLKGSLAASDMIDIAIKIAAIGEPGNSLVGVNAMPTVPRAGKTNVGDGEVSVLATANTTESFDLILRCISDSEETAGQNAHIDSSDYSAEENQGGLDGAIYGARYDNNRTNEEGSNGDNASVDISQLDGWSSSWASPLACDGEITADMYWLKFNSDPTSLLSDGDLIQFGSATAKSHVLLLIKQNDVGDWYGGFWPRPQATIPIGTKIYKVSSTSGFLIRCYDPTGTKIFEVDSYSLDGGVTQLPIRNLMDIYHVQNDNKGYNRGSPISSVGYEIRTDVSATIRQAPPHVETLTFADGVDGGTYALFAPETSQPAELETILADGTPHTIGSGTDYELKLTISAGDNAYVVGDYYSLQIIQAQLKVSFDNQSTWSAAIDINDGGTSDQDSDAEISIGNSITLKIELTEDETPFMLNDLILSVMGYRNGWRELADNLRSGKWRTKTCTDQQALLIDLGVGNTSEVDYLAIIDHNLQPGNNRVKYIGITGANIETCYGTTSSASYYSPTNETTIYVTPTSNPGINDHQNGYLVFIGGGAMGRAYLIKSNATSSYVVDGDCITDGASASGGDDYIIIPPDSYANFVANDVAISGGNNHGHPIANLSASSFTGRGHIIVFDDSTNPDGYIEMSFCLLGQRMTPQDESGACEAHNYIQDKTHVPFQIAIVNEAGEPIRGTRGVGSYIIPMEYYPISTHCREQLLDMELFCNNYDRVIPVAFWEDTTERNEIIMAYITGIKASTVPTSAGGIHSVRFNLVTLEYE